MAEKRFSELNTAGAMTGAELLAMSQETLGTLLSVKSTLQNIANWFAVNSQYASALDTSNKTLCGAINELKQLISLIPQFGIEVVQTLPTEDISETTIYLVPNSDPEQDNYYEEYIYVNNAWELVGTTEVDLSAYYTKLEVDGLLSAKANSSDVTTALALKEDKSSMNTDVTTIVVGLTDEQTTAPGNPVTLTTEQSGGAKSALVTFEPKQSGSGDPSPSNIRPISGRDSLNLKQCGKNLIPKKYYQYNASNLFLGLDSLDKENQCYLLPGTYTFKIYTELTTFILNYAPYDGSTISVANNNTITFTVTTPNYYRFWVNKSGVLPSDITAFQLERGNQATDYKPYKGEIHTVTFPDTVYGGSYDFVNGSGTLDKKFVSIDGSENWVEYPENSGKFYCEAITPNEAKVVISGTEYISNLYPFSGNGDTSSANVTKDKKFYGQRLHGRFWIYDSDYANDLVGFKTMLNTTPLQICYPLATPTEITLTPETIELLKGSNTVWTDGDTVQIKYSKLPNGNLGAVIDYIKKLEARVKALES